MNNLFFLFISLFFLMGSEVLAEKSSVLRIGMVEEPSSLNPVFRGSTAEGIIESLSVRSLAHFNFASELIPQLAKKAPYFKGKNLIFEIRENAKWDDGMHVTCEDFATGLSADRKFRKSDNPKVDVVVWDSKTPQACSVRFFQPKQVYTLYLPPPLPTHIEKNIIAASENEVDYLKKTLYSLTPTVSGLSNGPYRLSAYKPGYYFEFDRSPTFFGKAPYFEKLQIRFFKDSQSMLNAFRTKEIDMIINGLTGSRIEELQKIIDDNKLPNELKIKGTTKLTHLEFNLEKKTVGDINVRRALSLLINPVDLGTLVGLDGDLTGSVIHPNDPNFLPGFAKPNYKYDKKEAVKLLAKAGYKRNEKGELVDNAGQRLELNLIFNSESLDRERVATYLESQWSSIGIKVFLKKQLKRIMFSESLRKGQLVLLSSAGHNPSYRLAKAFIPAIQFHPRQITGKDRIFPVGKIKKLKWL